MTSPKVFNAAKYTNEVPFEGTIIRSSSAKEIHERGSFPYMDHDWTAVVIQSNTRWVGHQIQTAHDCECVIISGDRELVGMQFTAFANYPRAMMTRTVELNWDEYKKSHWFCKTPEQRDLKPFVQVYGLRRCNYFGLYYTNLCSSEYEADQVRRAELYQLHKQNGPSHWKTMYMLEMRLLQREAKRLAKLAGGRDQTHFESWVCQPDLAPPPWGTVK